MFMTEDVEAIQRMTALSEDAIQAHAELEQEYMLRLRFFHLDGGRGPLKGVHLVDCLRFVGIEPPVVNRTVDAPKKINWAEVELTDEQGNPTQVIVTRSIQQGTKQVQVKMLATYLGIFAQGRLAIRFGKNPSVDECAASEATLAPHYLPPDVKIEGEEFTATPGDAKREQDIADQYDEAPEAKAPAQLDPADTTGRWKPPKMQQNWDEMEGKKVLVELKDDTAEAMFVDIGPGDGHVTVYLPDAKNPTGGKQVVVDEAKVLVIA